MMGKRWEPWEDALVLKCERTGKAKAALGRRLGRTQTALRVRRSRIGPALRTHTRWTPEQDEAVAEGMPALQGILRRHRAHRASHTGTGRVPRKVAWRRGLTDGETAKHGAEFQSPVVRVARAGGVGARNQRRAVRRKPKAERGAAAHRGPPRSDAAQAGVRHGAGRRLVNGAYKPDIGYHVLS